MSIEETKKLIRDTMKDRLDKAYNQVLDFNTAAGTIPVPIREEDVILRERLLKEEIAEYREAVINKDAVEIVDALVDILYVALGVYQMHGIKPYYGSFKFNTAGGSINVFSISSGMNYANIMDQIVDGYIVADEKVFLLDALLSVLNDAIRHHGIHKYWEYFNTIHENNMTKFCKTSKEAADTLQYHGERKQNPYIVIVGDLFVVKRLDGKILKSINYKAVTIKL